MSKTCQSCGMPMKRNPQGGGSNSDGSKNTEYFSLCYENGKFTQPEFTAEDMQKFCIEKITECKIPGFVAWLFTRSIPKLMRWTVR